MRCLVVGGAGFIGSNLVDRLVDEGNEVIIFDDLSTGKKENVNEKAKLFQFDISNKNVFGHSLMKDLMSGVDVVYHTAAKARVQPSIKDPVTYNDVNVSGLVQMLKASVDAGVKRFVFSSSSSVYGDTDIFPTPESASLNPMSPYALQKLIGEQYCHLFNELYDIETVCLRYFNVYGERQLTEGAYCCVMGIFANQRLNDNPMTINGDGEQRRDFTYVGDVVEANYLAGTLETIKGGEIYNIGNGDNRSVNEMADLIGGEREHGQPVIEPKQTLADNSKASKELGWKPSTSLEDWVIKYKEELNI